MSSENDPNVATDVRKVRCYPQTLPQLTQSVWSVLVNTSGLPPLSRFITTLDFKVGCGPKYTVWFHFRNNLHIAFVCLLFKLLTVELPSVNYEINLKHKILKSTFILCPSISCHHSTLFILIVLDTSVWTCC